MNEQILEKTILDGPITLSMVMNWIWRFKQHNGKYPTEIHLTEFDIDCLKYDSRNDRKGFIIGMSDSSGYSYTLFGIKVVIADEMRLI